MSILTGQTSLQDMQSEEWNGSSRYLLRLKPGSTLELVEFLHDDLHVESFPWSTFPHKVGLHNSCSAVRGLGHARPSERIYEPHFSKTHDLLPARTFLVSGV